MALSNRSGTSGSAFASSRRANHTAFGGCADCWKNWWLCLSNDDLLCSACCLSHASQCLLPGWVDVDRGRALGNIYHKKPLPLEACYQLTVGISLTALVIYCVLFWNTGMAFPRPLPLSHEGNIVSQWQKLLKLVAERGYYVSMLVWFFAAAGIASWCWPGDKWRLPRRSASFLGALLGMALLAASSSHLDFPGLGVVRGIFYNQLPRITEILYLPLSVAMASGVALSIWFVTSLFRRSSRWARVLAIVVGLIIAICISRDHLYLYGHLEGLFDHYNKVFHTPRKSRIGNIRRWIMEKTIPSTILIYPPFDLDVLELWTGRAGLFMYGECPVNSYSPSCERQKKLAENVLSKVGARLRLPSPATQCIEAGIFGGPVVLFMPETFSISLPKGTLICSDAVFEGTLDGHAVVRYLRQA